MLDSGKKISRFARQKKKYSNSCVVRKIFSERNKKKNHTPPPFKLNGRSLGDVHNLISVQIKGNINPAKKSFKTYRSFKNFSEENFVNDLLMKSDLDKITEIEDVDEAYI
jgi:hypothetical protein